MSVFRRVLQSGFSLLEVMLAVSIAIALGSLQLGQVRRNTETAQAQAVGEQLRMVGGALNSYVALRYSSITTLSSVAGAGTASDPGPRTCNAGTGFCTITSDTLRRNGLLPNSFSGRNAYGATYLYHIRVTGTSPNWQVDGLVVTSTPYSIGANPRYDLIGQAMMSAGADSGTTRTIATQVDGFNGGWSETAFPVSALGLLAYRVGYGTSGYASYMRLDGGSAMSGDLNMGTNNITGVGNMTATGDVTASRVITAARSDALVLDNGANGTNIGTGAGNLVIRNIAGVQILDKSTNTPRPLQAGALTVSSVTASGAGTYTGGITASTVTSTTGNISSAGDVTANGKMTAGGNFETVNGNMISTNGNIAATNGIVSGATISSAGTLESVDGWNTTRYGGGWFMSDATWMRSFADKSIYTGGTVRGGTVTSDGLLTVSTVGIQLNSVDTVGGACTTGRQSRDATGRAMSCVSAVWRSTAGLSGGVTAVSASPCSGATLCYATCAAGYRISGGGYNLVTRPTVTDPYSPSQSYSDPTNNRWVVQSGSNTSFTAQALCVN